MKRKLFVVLFILVSITSFGQNLKVLDEKYGFRKAIFEMPFDSLKNLVEVEKGFYSSTSEELKLGEYELEKVIYSFYKGQLSAILIYIKGYNNSRGVLNILQQAYGKGYQDNSYIQEYSWSGKKVYMNYDENSATGGAQIILWSNKLRDIEKTEKNKAAAEATKQL